MNKKGFTIVELVIVIAVIAILAAVLIPTFSGLVENAKKTAIIQEARNRYSEYVAMHDYTKGDLPKNLVIEVEKENTIYYIAVKNSELQTTVYDSEEEAERLTDIGDAPLVCENHDWADGECNACNIKCPVEHVTENGNTECPTCGKANAIFVAPPAQ